MHHHCQARALQRPLCPCRPRPDRSCGKRRFADRLAADLTLAFIRSQGRIRGKEPVRSYHCAASDGWHLTSSRSWCARPMALSRNGR